MPTDIDRCNQLIVMRILNRSHSSEHHESDTSCYREMKNLVTSAHGKNNRGARLSSDTEAFRGREWRTILIFRGA